MTESVAACRDAASLAKSNRGKKLRLLPNPPPAPAPKDDEKLGDRAAAMCNALDKAARVAAEEAAEPW